MDFSHVKRNDPCPCGSGKKFKNCHMGREQDIMADRLQVDPSEMAIRITKLPASGHERAAKMAESISFTSAAGKKVTIKLVDLDDYLALNLVGQKSERKGPGGVLVNPHKTRVLDPTHVYVAVSDDADDSTVIHQFAHAADLIEGSALIPGQGQALARETGLPAELLEHPQEYGDKLVELAEKYQVTLDAEDEIVAFLARRRMLLPGKMIAGGKRDELVAAAEKTLRFMRENQDELDARIKTRAGYQGKTKEKA